MEQRINFQAAYKYLLLSCLFFLLGTCLLAQNNPVISKEKEETIDSLSHQSSIYRGQEDWESWFICKSQIIKILRQNLHLVRALDSLDTWSANGALRKIDMGKFHYLRGLLNTDIGNISRGIDHYKKTLDIFRVIGDSTIIQVAYRNIGNNYSRLNDHVHARLYYNWSLDYANALNIDEKKINNLKYQMVDSYTYEGSFDTALEYLTEHLQDYKKTTRFQITKASLYLEQGHLSKAEKVIDNIEGDKANPYWYFRLLTSFHEQKNDIKSAIRAKKKVLNNLKFKSSQRDYVAEEIRLAKLYIQDNQFGRADSILNTSITFFLPDYKDDGDYLKSLNVQTPSIWLVEAFKSKADLRYVNDYPKNHHLIKDYYQTAFRILSDLKHHFHSNISKTSYGVLSKEIVEKIGEINYLGYTEHGEPKYLNETFLTTQRANAFVLRNTINQRSALQHSSLDSTLADEYIKLSYNVSQADKSISPEVIGDYASIKKELLNNSTSLKQFFDQTVLSTKEVQEYLDEESCFVKYFITAEAGYIFIIAKQQSNLIKIEIPSQFKSWVEQINQAILEPGLKESETNYLNASYQLYKHFFKPVLEINKKASKYIIVPDSYLRNVSFAGLVQKPTTTWLNTEDFLLHDYAFNYLYYTAQLREDKTTSQGKFSFVGFALSYEGEYEKTLRKELLDGHNYAELDFGEDLMIETLNAAIPGVRDITKKLSGTFLTNEDINKLSIQDNLSKARIAHFSGHTILDRENHLNSALLVYPDANDQNLLFKSSDILQLNLDNELITLSTCESSTGKLLQAEGVMSMGRSCMYSGAKSVLGNVWKTTDNGTASIMNEFYSKLKKGKQKNVALREAQIMYLNDANISPLMKTPAFWAGWVLYGNYQPIHKPFGSFPLYAGIALIVLLGLYILARTYARQ